jgi:hypothetical protein
MGDRRVSDLLKQGQNGKNGIVEFQAEKPLFLPETLSGIERFCVLVIPMGGRGKSVSGEGNTRTDRPGLSGNKAISVRRRRAVKAMLRPADGTGHKRVGEREGAAWLE